MLIKRYERSITQDTKEFFVSYQRSSTFDPMSRKSLYNCGLPVDLFRRVIEGKRRPQRCVLPETPQDRLCEMVTSAHSNALLAECTTDLFRRVAVQEISARLFFVRRIRCGQLIFIFARGTGCDERLSIFELIEPVDTRFNWNSLQQMREPAQRNSRKLRDGFGGVG